MLLLQLQSQTLPPPISSINTLVASLCFSPANFLLYYIWEAMEAAALSRSSSILVSSKFPHDSSSSLSIQTSLFNPTPPPSSFRFKLTLSNHPSPLLALPPHLSNPQPQDEQEDEDLFLDKNKKEELSALFTPDNTLSLSQGNSNHSPCSSDADKTSHVVRPPLVSYGSATGGGTRAGLFRTPISGGVQSATSAHGLPRPALAVRNLMEQARFAHLCTVMSRMHHRREGYPFGSLVDFAPDAMGHPIFSFSPLAIHTRNLLVDPRCTLVVQIPGWSGLSNARVTIFGDVFPLPEEQQEWAHKQYIAKHHQGPSQQWGNFYYFRMQNIRDIYFIGGFGTVAWVDVNEYEAVRPDKIAVDGGEQNLKELNAMFSKPLKELLSLEAEVDDAALISIDSKGTDVRVRQGAQFNIQRLSFEEGNGVETLEEAKAAVRKLLERGLGQNLQK